MLLNQRTLTLTTLFWITVTAVSGCSGNIGESTPEESVPEEVTGTPPPVVSGPAVGIIPGPMGTCPSGSEPLYIVTDDEDTNNISSVSGWVGQITPHPVGTAFRFCRVDGNRFGLGSTPYAVLQLAATCPAGSASMKRYFYNEQDNNKNGSSPNITPNFTGIGGLPQRAFTDMNFCFFPSVGSGAYFPSFGITYGVFANAGAGVLATGVVLTDDQDGDGVYSGKNDVTSGPAAYLASFRTIVHGSGPDPFYGPNTYFHVAQVEQGPIPLSATLNGPAKVTRGGTYTYEIMPTGGNGIYSYSWFNGSTQKTADLGFSACDGDLTINYTVKSGVPTQTFQGSRTILNMIPCSQ